MDDHKSTHILTLDTDDPAKELEFEVRYRLSLTVEERFRRMWERSFQIARELKTHGHQKTPLIIQRS